MAVIIDEVDATMQPEAAPANAPAPPAPSPDTTKSALIELHQNLRRLQKRTARLRAD